MASETTENFFLLLELDPDAPWDQEEFKRKLREKQSRWSRESMGPTKKALLAKKRLELLPVIERVMSDKAQREALARAAKEEASSDQNAKLEEFARRLRQAELKGFLEESEVAGFISAFQHVLSEQEIRARIKVEIRRPTVDQDQDEDGEEIKATILADINANLALLGMTDLYQLLALPATASCEELYRAAEQLSGELLLRSQKTSAVSAQTILVGHAKLIFKTQEMRRRYDNSLQYQTLDALLKELAETVRHTSEKKVYVLQIEAFIQEASKMGWKSEVAERRLKQYARQHGWQLEENTDQVDVSHPDSGQARSRGGDAAPISSSQVNTTNEVEQGIRCGFCGEINERELSLCRNCHSALSQTCQKCGQSIAADEKRCKSCGFPYIHEVRNLKFQNTGLGLRLSWTWPMDCNEARIFYSTAPGQEHQQSTTVTRSEYEALGHYLLRGAIQQNYYILVSLVMRYEGQQILTPGTRLYVPLTNKMDITYEIKNPRFGYKQRTLHLYTQTSGILPTLLLMTRWGDIPTSKTEGTLLHREPGPISIQREHVLVLPDTRFPTKTFGRLFLEDDSLYTVVVIHLPHERKLRLG